MIESWDFLRGKQTGNASIKRMVKKNPFEDMLYVAIFVFILRKVLKNIYVADFVVSSSSSPCAYIHSCILK